MRLRFVCRLDTLIVRGYSEMSCIERVSGVSELVRLHWSPGGDRQLDSRWPFFGNSSRPLLDAYHQVLQVCQLAGLQVPLSLCVLRV